jgi:Ni/Co efflux regulator RcnB
MTGCVQPSPVLPEKRAFACIREPVRAITARTGRGPRHGSLQPAWGGLQRFLSCVLLLVYSQAGRRISNNSRLDGFAGPVRQSSRHDKHRETYFMNMYARVLMAGLMLASVAAVASPFPETASHAGMLYYRTGQPVPAKYLADDHRIINYHHYHLDKPMDGYTWVHGEENEYLLVSTTSHILRRIEYRENISPETESSK